MNTQTLLAGRIHCVPLLKANNPVPYERWPEKVFGAVNKTDLIKKTVKKKMKNPRTLIQFKC